MLGVLRSGVVGYEVSHWQTFLRGQGFTLSTTGDFDQFTDVATRSFQKRYHLDADGIVGNQTFGQAAKLGFEIVDFVGIETAFPARPTFPPLTDNAVRQQQFGPLEFVPQPTIKNPEAIRITNDWEQNNVKRVVIPELIGVKGARPDGAVLFHAKCVSQLSRLWAAWQAAGLLPRVLTYDGAYNPRFVRGRAKEQILSNHAFATAFDLNYEWNKLGAEPATFGRKGCVYELVPIAHAHGFYWGGHFSRRDGMHFEEAQLMP